MHVLHKMHARHVKRMSELQRRIGPASEEIDWSILNGNGALMKATRFIVCTLTLFLFASPLTSSHAQNKPTIELKPYYMILFLHADGKQVSENINAQHLRYMEHLATGGR